MTFIKRRVGETVPADVAVEHLSSTDKRIVREAVKRLHRTTQVLEGRGDRRRRYTRDRLVDPKDTTDAYLTRKVGYTTKAQIQRWHKLASVAIDLAVTEWRLAQRIEPIQCEVCGQTIERGFDTRGRPTDANDYAKKTVCSLSCSHARFESTYTRPRTTAGKFERRTA